MKLLDFRKNVLSSGDGSFLDEIIDFLFNQNNYDINLDIKSLNQLFAIDAKNISPIIEDDYKYFINNMIFKDYCKFFDINFSGLTREEKISELKKVNNNILRIINSSQGLSFCSGNLYSKSSNSREDYHFVLNVSGENLFKVVTFIYQALKNRNISCTINTPFIKDASTGLTNSIVIATNARNIEETLTALESLPNDVISLISSPSLMYAKANSYIGYDFYKISEACMQSQALLMALREGISNAVTEIINNDPKCLIEHMGETLANFRQNANNSLYADLKIFKRTLSIDPTTREIFKKHMAKEIVNLNRCEYAFADEELEEIYNHIDSDHKMDLSFLSDEEIANLNRKFELDANADMIGDEYPVTQPEIVFSNSQPLTENPYLNQYEWTNTSNTLVDESIQQQTELGQSLQDGLQTNDNQSFGSARTDLEISQVNDGSDSFASEDATVTQDEKNSEYISSELGEMSRTLETNEQVIKDDSVGEEYLDSLLNGMTEDKKVNLEVDAGNPPTQMDSLEAEPSLAPDLQNESIEQFHNNLLGTNLENPQTTENNDSINSSVGDDISSDQEENDESMFFENLRRRFEKKSDDETTSGLNSENNGSEEDYLDSLLSGMTEDKSKNTETSENYEDNSQKQVDSLVKESASDTNLLGKNSDSGLDTTQIIDVSEINSSINNDRNVEDTSLERDENDSIARDLQKLAFNDKPLPSQDSDVKKQSDSRNSSMMLNDLSQSYNYAVPLTRDELEDLNKTISSDNTDSKANSIDEHIETKSIIPTIENNASHNVGLVGSASDLNQSFQQADMGQSKLSDYEQAELESILRGSLDKKDTQSQKVVAQDLTHSQIDAINNTFKEVTQASTAIEQALSNISSSSIETNPATITPEVGEDLSREEVNSLIADSKNIAISQEMMEKYESVLDNIDILNQTIIGTNITFLHYFETNRVLDIINPSWQYKLNNGEIVTGREFINNSLIRDLLNDGNVPLRQLLDEHGFQVFTNVPPQKRRGGLLGLFKKGN